MTPTLQAGQEAISSFWQISMSHMEETEGTQVSMLEGHPTSRFLLTCAITLPPCVSQFDVSFVAPHSHVHLKRYKSLARILSFWQAQCNSVISMDSQ